MVVERKDLNTLWTICGVVAMVAEDKWHFHGPGRILQHIQAGRFGRFEPVISSVYSLDLRVLQVSIVLVLQIN